MKYLIILTIIFANIIFALSTFDSHLTKHSKNILKQFHNRTDEELFNAFHHIHKKQYKKDSNHGLEKKKHFSKNLKIIKDHNSKNRTYTLGIGPFADMSQEDFTKNRLMKKEHMSKLINSTSIKKRFLAAARIENVQTPITNINWSSLYRPALDQGDCGSCWAFSTASVLEANYKLNFGGAQLKLSAQNLVDCSTTNFACDGGVPPNALDYVKSNGIIFDDSYPYTSGHVTTDLSVCKSSLYKANFILDSYSECAGYCGRANLLSLLSKGPIMGLMDASSPILQHYTGGVLQYTCDSTGPNHSINIVGVSNDNTGGYYIVRNSWGDSWGENGYFRMRFDDSTSSCFLEAFGFLPITTQINNTPTPNPCMQFYSECNSHGTPSSVCQNTKNFTGFVSGFIRGNATTVTVFNSPNCRGTPSSTYDFDVKCFNDDVHGLSNFTNEVGSVILDWNLETPPNGCIWAYSDCCFLSTKLEICKSIPDLSVAAYNFAKKISSIRMGPGVNSYVVWSNVNYHGHGFHHTGGDTTCLDPSMMNLINSIQIS